MCFKCEEGGGEIPGVQIVQVVPSKMLEVAVTLRKAFMSDSIGLNAHQSFDGSDWYECPCCGAERREKGNLYGTASIDSVEHDGDCALFKAHKLLEELDHENPVLFAE